jgi:hypothetical protein
MPGVPGRQTIEASPLANHATELINNICTGAHSVTVSGHRPTLSRIPADSTSINPKWEVRRTEIRSQKV